jgi:hypothetical protein
MVMIEIHKATEADRRRVRQWTRREGEGGQRTMRIEESVEINRPPEQVFEYVANPENLPEWTGTVIETRKDTPRPLLEGSTFTSVGKFLGRKIESPFEITGPRVSSASLAQEHGRTVADGVDPHL